MNVVFDPWGRVIHEARNEFDFTYNCTDYEKDLDSGRYYRLDASISLSARRWMVLWFAGGFPVRFTGNYLLWPPLKLVIKSLKSI